MRNHLIICIVDDDKIQQLIATRTIEKQHLADKILTFSNGEQAIEFLVKHLEDNKDMPDVIFLDINMPIMDGWQFLEEYIKIKPRIGKKITIYLLSALINSADIERAKKISEVSDYLVKPVTSEKFKELIEALENT
jgi:CheY-like chemotaxis protein